MTIPSIGVLPGFGAAGCRFVDAALFFAGRVGTTGFFATALVAADFFGAGFFGAGFFAGGWAGIGMVMPGMLVWADTGADRVASASALAAANKRDFID